MLPDSLRFLAATNPISEFAASRNHLLCNCLHTYLELWLIFLDHIVMLDEFLHLQSQNAEFKPNWDNEFRFSETLVATLSKMVITEILLMQKTTCKKELKPKVGKIQHGQSSFIPVHRLMFLDNKKQFDI